MVRLRFLTILICLGCLSGGITGLTTASTIQAQEEDEDPVVEVYVPDPGGLSWSPDGQHIVFNYAWATYVMDQDASNLRWITSDYPFRWMPDSHAFITFSYIPGTYQMEWWRTPIDGTGRQRIFAEGASGTMPVYAPNGHRVAFYGRFNEMESDALWIADVLDDGRTENPILVADALLNGYFVWDITWSTTRDELTLKLLQNATRRYYFMTLSLNQPNFPIENLNQVKMQRLESDDDHLIDLGGDWSLEYDPQRSN
jgi:Tol biopolymer transport system component